MHPFRPETRQLRCTTVRYSSVTDHLQPTDMPLVLSDCAGMSHAFTHILILLMQMQFMMIGDIKRGVFTAVVRPKTCHPNATASTMLSRHAVSMPGATEDISNNLRRHIADADMLLHGPRGAASTGNIKVAFCQSFSVRRHKTQASSYLRTCGLPGADQ